MPQFFVLAYDGTDAGALERRHTVRGTHFEGIKLMIERNEIRAAGAILDDAGNMVGSVPLIINTVRLSLAQFFGVPRVTALSAEYDHLYRRELTDESWGVPWTMNRPDKLNLMRRF